MNQKTLKTKPTKDLEYDISKAFFGIFAVILGLIFLINNLGLYSISVSFTNLWPLLVVFIGLSLFRKKNVVSTVVGSIITITCFSLFSYALALDTISNSNSVYINTTTPIVVVKDMNMKNAEIDLEAGAGEVNVYGIDTDNLIEGRIVSNILKSEINQSIIGTMQKVIIGFTGSEEWMNKKDNFKNQFNIGINKNTPLNFVFSSGGSSNVIDLSDIQAENVRIGTGASDLSLKLGDKVNSNVTIEAGVSSINLKLPETVGIRMTINSGLSSQELLGFVLISKDTYQSLNYDDMEKKINIDVTMGIASLKVEWYTPLKMNEISLFYYNKLADKDSSCNVSYILPVKRTLVNSNNQIKDAIKLLIEGKITEQEKIAGFITEFPNKDFKLLDSNIDNAGVLTLTFSEVPGFTTGGMCRVILLGSEIIRTAKQFPEVKKVVFLPETLFQP